ncbi:YraN family protein [Roseospira visakhapatnamensis]|uniref:UPF0102 protein GGD89_002281 n=1 Tax=Roseospira visakhapatnamensis TaxID=390880 RepID=A0A7W6RDN4_9PROT|nr:YraN family protein [Roseospira visakhapatnamensis]MBB4266649.1 putative endonuclease [Roseospira visakhapatnamensis]
MSRSRPAAARRAADRAGRAAEDDAAAWLEARGWTVLARRAPGQRGRGVGEIDLIAQDGPVLVFVEVKARPSAAAALAAVTPAQRRRLATAAEAWLAAHPDHGADGVRFDVVAVPADGAPVHVPDAWRPEPEA